MRGWSKLSARSRDERSEIRDRPIWHSAARTALHDVAVLLLRDHGRDRRIAIAVAIDVVVAIALQNSAREPACSVPGQHRLTNPRRCTHDDAKGIVRGNRTDQRHVRRWAPP